MKALITGGLGFIGGRLAAKLQSEDNEVIILDNREGVLPPKELEGATVVLGDIRDTSTVREAAQKADVIFHLAAIKSVPRSIEDPFTVESVNALGTLSVLTAAEDLAIPVVYASSSSCYGDSLAPVKRETDPTRPISPYGVSKLTGELYCHVWSHLSKVRTVCLRFFNVFGPGQSLDSTYAAIFPAFTSALLRGIPPRIFGTGDQSRSFTYVDDVVPSLIKAWLAIERADGLTINICREESVSVNQVLKTISDAVGTWIEPEYLDARQGDIMHSRGDVQLANSVLGWRAENDWKASVETTVAWLRAQESVLSID